MIGPSLGIHGVDISSDGKHMLAVGEDSRGRQSVVIWDITSLYNTNVSSGVCWKLIIVIPPTPQY